MLLIYYGIALGLHLVSLAEQGKKIKASTLCDPKSLWQEDHQIIIYASGLDGLPPNARGQHLNNLKFLQVLSDSTKKRSYNEQLRKEDSKRVCQRSCGTPQQAGVDHRSEESRCIRCTKCGNSHLWICTNRTKAKARWCQECFLYHPAKDGDGWVEKMPQKVEIPCAFVCAESKIFDVSEWASCQGVKTKTPAPPLERPPLELRTNLCSLFAAFVQETPEPFPLPTEASIVKAAAG